MRKIYNLFIPALLLVGGTVFAQSLEIVHADENPFAGSDEFLLASHAVVKNVGQSTIDVQVKRIEQSVISGTINYFCWAQCYDPSVDVSPDVLNFTPGQERSEFVADYEPDGNEGTTTITYVFFNSFNPNDSVAYTVNYLVTPIGVEENSWAIRDPYPNPAKDIVVFEYQSGNSGEVVLELYDLLGNVRKVAQLNTGSNRMELNVSDLEPGVYVYSMKLDGATTITKKLVVSRN